MTEEQETKFNEISLSILDKFSKIMDKELNNVPNEEFFIISLAVLSELCGKFSYHSADDVITSHQILSSLFRISHLVLEKNIADGKETKH